MPQTTSDELKQPLLAANDLAYRINEEAENQIIPTNLSKSIKKSSRYNPYLWHEIILDLFLLGLAAWAQFGYASFSRQTSLASLNDPMEHYLYPHLDSNKVSQTKEYMGYIIQSFSYADAALTTGTYLNMRNCRNEFTNGMQTGIEDYKKGQIYFPIFCLNLGLMLSTFFIGSLSPWTGFAMQNRNRVITNSFGSTMFVGLMISYAMSYAPYIFSASKNLTNFSKLTKKEKKEMILNVFTSKKGLLGFLPRSSINLINRAWVVYGLAMLTSRYVFGTTNIYIVFPYAILGGISSAYQTFMSQGVKDYRVTFPSETRYSQIFQPETQVKSNACSRVGFFAFNALLSILSVAVFVLRTLTVPSLYTGQIDDPANNYNTKDTILAALGLLFGGYAAFQYSRFRYGRWQDNFSTFFRPEPNRSNPNFITVNNSYSINDANLNNDLFLKK